MQNNINDPYAYTLDDKITQIISGLLNRVAPGVGQFLTPIVKPLGYKALGISSDDAMVNAIVDTNQTPYGVFNLLQKNRIDRGAGYAVKHITDASKLNALRGISRTLVDEKAWGRLDPASRGASYTEYIESKATERSSNWLWNMLYGVWDPNGMGKASPYLANAASNMIRKGVGRGDRDSYIKASQVMRGMFTDDKGNYDFNSKDYGFLNQADVAAVAANLTKDIDVLANTKRGQVTKGRLKETIDKFKNMLKDYSAALAPLKDIFGGDMQSMLQAIESITGSSISSLGAARVRNIASSISDNLASGKYSAQELFHVTNQFRASMKASPGLSRFNRGHAHLLAIDTLGAVNGGLIPVGVDKADFASYVAKMEQSVDSGGMAEIADLAYVAWANKQKAAGNKDTSINDFRKAIKKQQTNGKSTIAALYAIAGVKNQYELRKYMGFSTYRTAKDLGVGRVIARDELYNMNRKGFVNSLASSGYLRELSGKSGSPRHTETSDKAIIEKTMDILEKDTSLLSNAHTDESLLIAFANKFKGKNDKDITSIAEFNKLDKASKRYDNAVRAKRTLEFLKNNDNYKDAYLGLIARDNVNKSREEAIKAKTRREQVNKLSLYGIGTIKENLSDILGLGNGKGLDMNRLTELLSNHITLSKTDDDIGAEMRIATSSAYDNHMAHNMFIKLDEKTRNTYKGKGDLKLGESLFAREVKKNGVLGDFKTNTSVQSAYLAKASSIVNSTDKNSEDYQNFSSWFNGVYKKQKGNEKATISSNANDNNAIIRAYADYVYTNDIKSLKDATLNANQYVLSDAGLNNAEYRQAMHRYMEASKIYNDNKGKGDKAVAAMKEMKDLSSYLEITRKVSSDALTTYIERDNGLATKDNIKNATTLRKANMDRLISLYRTNGITEVQHELGRANMVKNIAALKKDKNLGGIVTSLEQKFMQSVDGGNGFTDKKDLFSSKNLKAFSMAAYEKFLIKERELSSKSAKYLEDKIKKAEAAKITDDKAVLYEEQVKGADGKILKDPHKVTLGEAKERLKKYQDTSATISSILTQGNRSGQGLGSILTLLKDAINAFSGATKEFTGIVKNMQSQGNSTPVVKTVQQPARVKKLEG